MLEGKNAGKGKKDLNLQQIKTGNYQLIAHSLQFNRFQFVCLFGCVGVWYVYVCVCVFLSKVSGPPVRILLVRTQERVYRERENNIHPLK